MDAANAIETKCGTMTDYLQLQSIHKRYGNTSVLHGIDLQVAAGSRTAIVGPSGSGKTTLLRIIAGFEAPTTGRLSLGGNVLADGKQFVPAHLRGIGFVPQEGALFPHLSVAENIGFGLPRKTADRPARIQELMDMVALDQALLHSRPHEISGGQQQRVALARALAQRPKLILLDEPFSALDTGLRVATRKAVADLLARAGITTILVTHDQAEALSFADTIAIMRNGRLVQVGAAKAVYQTPLDAETATFLGDAILLPAKLENGIAHCALGSIPVEASASTGSQQILLRPEQLSIVGATQQTTGSSSTSTAGVVTGLNFLGSTCDLQIRLNDACAQVPLSPDSTESGISISVKVPTNPTIAVGSQVLVAVSGTAHVLRSTSSV
jgi:iron(III) transport system ATP-binding protein